MNHLVREMKKYGHIKVANALCAIGWEWPNPRRRPTNVDKMVGHLPRCELVKILNYLRNQNKI